MRTFARVCAAVCLTVSAFAQTRVTIEEKAGGEPTETLLYRDGSGSTEYICTAVAQNSTNVFAVTAGVSTQPRSSIALAELTDIAISSNVATVTTTEAHGLRIGNRITVSGSAVTAINTTFRIASVPSGTTFTFAVTADDATLDNEGLKFTTTAPRTNSNFWAIKRLFYTGTALDREVWADGSNANDKACDSRAAYWQ